VVQTNAAPDGTFLKRSGSRDVSMGGPLGVHGGPLGVSAVVLGVGPARRGGGVGLVVELAQRRGVVGGGVDVGLLQRSGVEVGALVRLQIVLVEGLQRDYIEANRDH